jgi:hypothetical protein
VKQEEATDEHEQRQCPERGDIDAPTSIIRASAARLRV